MKRSEAIEIVASIILEHMSSNDSINEMARCVLYDLEKKNLINTKVLEEDSDKNTSGGNDDEDDNYCGAV